MFVNQGKVYEIYARKVTHGDLFGFIEVEELLFGERSSVVLDPSEERIKGEFAGVKRTFLPLHSVLRIDEVRKHGVSKIMALEGGANVAQFPMPLYSTPPEKNMRCTRSGIGVTRRNSTAFPIPFRRRQPRFTPKKAKSRSRR